MKKSIFILLFLLSILASAQVAQPYSIAQDPSMSTADKLVYLAWENDHAGNIANSQVAIADYNVKLAALEWLNTITITGNLNEFNIDPESDNFNRSAFFPRYNVRGNIAIGSFFTIPIATKRSREELKIANSLVDNRKQELRAAVLTAYNTYLMEEKVYQFRLESAIDAENKLKANEEKFRDGLVSFDEYSESRTRNSEVQISLAVAEAAYKNARVYLEGIVGVDLDGYLSTNMRR